MKLPKFQLTCNGDGGTKKVLRLKNVSSVIVSNIRLESFALLFLDGDQTNLLTTDPRLPFSLSPGEEQEFICDHRDLKARPLLAKEIRLTFSVEDEDSNAYHVSASKNVEDSRDYALGAWNVIVEPQAESRGDQMKKHMKIFISHRGPEAKMAEAFVDFFEDLGVQPESIVCTSVSGHLVPNGEDIYDWLRHQFTDYDLHVIFLLSNAYYKSAACLNEMGAAWVKGSKSDIILTPGFKADNVEGVLGKSKMAIEWDAKEDILFDRIAQLRDSVCDEFGLPKPYDRRWDNKRNELIEKVRRIAPSEPETEGE